MNQEDLAQAEELIQWSRLNAPRPVRPVYKPGDEGYGPEYCKNDECEADMPENRRADGQTLCTTCKSMVEVRAKRRY